jgi:predicted aspartyl protease
MIILNIILGILAIAAFVYIMVTVFKPKKGVPFHNFDVVDVPYISVDINGKSYNFIVDTGSGVSIIDSSLLNKGFKYSRVNKEVNVSGIEGNNHTMSAVNIDFSINNKKVNEDFYVHDCEEMFGNFETLYNITISGLLGSSFLNKYKGIIDFDKLTIRIS